MMKWSIWRKLLSTSFVLTLLAIQVMGLATPPPAEARGPNAMRPGFDTSYLPGNDDGSTAQLPIGFDINFFGTTYGNLWVNNNGNVTFRGPQYTYTPYNLYSAGVPIIASFFADVDTRAGNVVRYGTGTVDGRPAFGVNWPGVGCYSMRTHVLNYFQQILIDRSDIGPGNFDIEFNYDQIQWEAGSASGGNANCLGGSPARVGYSNGTPANSFELPGSGIAGSFLDSNLSIGLIRGSVNSSQLGRYVFAVRNGRPIEVNLSLTKTDSPDPVLVGGQLTYNLTVANAGPDPATGVIVTDPLPPTVSFGSASASQGSCGVAGSTVTCDLGTIPAGGSASVGIQVTPSAGGSIDNTASVRANEPDPNNGDNSVSASTTVNAVNHAPVAHDDGYNASEDTPLVVAPPGVLGNDSDLDGNTLTVVVMSGPGNGIVTLNSDGSFSYTPNANFNGLDSFTYKANDGGLDSNVATVTISVSEVNDAPIAAADAAATAEDTALVFSAAALAANDSAGPGDESAQSLAVIGVAATGETHGTVSLAGGNVIYTPEPNFNGSASFSYTVQDNGTTSGLPDPKTGVGTVNVTVTPVNDAPVANDDAYVTDEDTVSTVEAAGVLSNDTDPDVDGARPTAVLVSGPSHGALTLSPNGSFVYTPTLNYNGPDTFTYKANDGSLDSNVATVTITVNAVNDEPVANPQEVGVDEGASVGITLTGSDIEGSPLTYSVLTSPSHGVLSGAPPVITYTANVNYDGPDGFTFKTRDGSLDSVPAVVSITVRNVGTFVSGNITVDTHWTLEGSPYFVTGDLKIDSGVTLTVDPGVVVKFNHGSPGYALLVGGTLYAVGTPTQPITFTSNQASPAAGDWGGIYFLTGSHGKLERVVVEYAGRGLTDHPDWHFGLRIEGADVTLYDSTVRNNLGDGVQGIGPVAPFELGGNTISGSGGNGISLTGYPGVTYLGGNTVAGNLRSGLRIEGTSNPALSALSNSIYGNVSYAIENASNAAVDATGTWFGTTVRATINALIYDYYDNAAWGVVTFAPADTPPPGTPPTVEVRQPDFSMGAAPSSGTIGRGGTLDYTIVLTSLRQPDSSSVIYADDSPVALMVTGLPSGITGTLGVSSTIPLTTGAPANLHLIDNGAQIGTYRLWFTGRGISYTHSVSATLVVDRPIDPAVSCGPGFADQYEQNDSRGRAYTIVSGTDYRGCVAGTADRDWFRVYVPQARSLLDTNVTGMTSDYDLYVVAATGAAGSAGSTDMDSIDMDSIDMDSIDMDSIDMDSIDMDSIDMDSIDMDSIDMESIDMDSIDMDSIDMDSIDMDSIDMDSIDMDSIDMDSIDMDSIGQLVGKSRKSGTQNERSIITAFRAGWYYVLVRPRTNSTAGEYTLRVNLGLPKILPPPRVSFVPPNPSPAPVDPSVKTLILFNRTRLAQYYGGDAADQVGLKLQALVPLVGGRVVALDDPELKSAYDAWDRATSNPIAANALAGAIRAYLWKLVNLGSATPSYPNVANVIIVGHDDIVPFWRVEDRAPIAPESQYASKSAAGESSAVYAALKLNYFLTDDMWAGPSFIDFMGHELFVPEWAVGRLVETPEEIIAMIDSYVANNGRVPANGFVSAYDFMQDAGQEALALLRGSGMAVDGSLVGPAWPGSPQADSLKARLAGNPQLIGLANHYLHYATIAPDGTLVSGADISATLGLSGAVAFALGCHSALNIPDVDAPAGLTLPDKRLDVVQAFARRGVIYIGNTGYGYGDTEAVAYSEQLWTYLAEELAGVRSRGGTVGQAFVRAKQRYLFTNGAAGFGVVDEKALVESAFYGIPNFRFGPEETVAVEPPPVIDPGSGDLVSQGLTLRPSLRRVDVGEVSYYTAEGVTVQVGQGGPTYTIAYSPTQRQVSALRPTSPKVTFDVGALSGVRAKGAVFLGGTYSVTAGFRPQVGDPSYDDGVDSSSLSQRIDATREYTSTKWWPSKLGMVNSLGRVADEGEKLVVLPGQFHSPERLPRGIERVFDSMEYAVYYSNSSHRLAPSVRSVQAYYDAPSGLVRFVVEAVGMPRGGEAPGSAPRVTRVLVAYTDIAGASREWRSLDLAQDPASGLWVGVLPAFAFAPALPGEGQLVQFLDGHGAVHAGLEYFVQVVDDRGNVAQADNRDDYYTLDTSSTTSVDPAIAFAAYSWSFGDGGTAGGRNPSHAYGDNGRYSAALRVDTNVGTGVVTRTVPISNAEPAVDVPVVSPEPSSEGSPVSASATFTDTGLSDVPFSCTVNYGDGSGNLVGTVAGYGCAGPSHTYSDSGSYVVVVSVVDKDGGVGTRSVTHVASNVAPVVTPPASQVADEGSPTSFNLGAFADPGPDSPWAVDVDWGDGSAYGAFSAPVSGTLGARSHTYANNRPGGEPYTLVVRVKDKDNGEGTATFTVAVRNVPPAVNSSVVLPEPSDEGSSATASATFGDPGADDGPYTCTVSYGDGTGDLAGTVVGGTCAGPIHTYADSGPYTVGVSVTDKDGGVGSSSAVHAVNNVAPSVTAPADQSADEGMATSFNLGGFSDPGPDAPWAVDVDWGDGSAHSAFTTALSGTLAAKSHTYADNGVYVVAVTVTDKNGGIGSGSFRVTVGNLVPTVGPTAALGNPIPVSVPIVVTARFTDAGRLDTHTAVWDWGDGLGSAGGVSEASGTGSANGSHAYAAAGFFTITLTLTDKDGGTGQSVFRFAIVTDPSAGFVTGEGKISSPAGAYASSPSSTGRAEVEFNARYRRGARVPTGETEFEYKAGNLNLHSTSYEWLVISGPRVYLKGIGRMNGRGDYGFLISGIDGQANGGGGIDRIRIKVWDVSGSVIYDSEPGEADYAPATMPLAQGKVIIHREGDDRDDSNR